VIDIHGFLGRTSSYWTVATTRTHKVTKPLIWVGIIIATIGGLIFYRGENFSGIPLAHAIIAFVLILNGCFLSFVVSPYILKREREGRSGELLPRSWQTKNYGKPCPVRYRMVGWINFACDIHSQQITKAPYGAFVKVPINQPCSLPRDRNFQRLTLQGLFSLFLKILKRTSCTKSVTIG
jgi:hypothetical protein